MIKIADVKWIKITTDIFDDEKILLIESLPDADAIIVIWFKLLCLAGKMNNSGVFMLNDRIPITEKMLATIFRRKELTVELALKTFQDFGMIEIIDNVITIPKWGKHQNLDQLEQRKEYMRGYMKDYRKKQKQRIGVEKYNQEGLKEKDWIDVLNEFSYECAYCGCKENLEQDHVVPFAKGGVTAAGNIVPACRRCNSSKNDSDAFEWYAAQPFYDEEKCKHLRKYLDKHLRKVNVNALDKIREDKDKIREDKTEERNDNVSSTLRCKEVVELYHKLCPSFPKVRRITKKRTDAIKARLRTYGIDEIKECFTKAEKSRFLKGGNDRNWTADFDWLMKESNITKVLEGKYDNREAPVKQVKNSFNNFEQRTYDYEALEKKLHARGRQNVRHMP